MAIEVIREKCKGCAICVSACPFGAIEMREKAAVIVGGCTGCAVCIEKCPFGAITAPGEAVEAADLSGYRDVWVFAEQRGGRLTNVALELLGEGHRLSRELGGGCKVCAVLLGWEVDGLVDELYAYGADCVYLLSDPLLERYTTDAYTKALCGAIRRRKPEIVLYGATHIGRDLAPRVAARLDTGLTADCTRLDVDTGSYIAYLQKNTALETDSLAAYAGDKNLKQTRPAFGGNLMATILCPGTRPQMSTVRPGVMQKLPREEGRRGELVKLEAGVEPEDVHVRVLDIVKAVKAQVSLTDAEIVVSGGRGLGGPEGFALIHRFAEAVGGVVGASRAAVDAGWIDSAHQVGQTGTTVKPSIYFACGISGAIQHQVGMQGSGCIVAINKDADAPMMKLADFSLCGDLFKIIPEIISLWSAQEV